MQLPERIMTRWARCSRVASRHLAIDETGVSLGKTLLAPFVNGRLQVDAESVIAMLSAAYNRKVPDSIIDSFRHAERCFKRGDKALANMHLALTGLHAVDLDMAQRLFVADWAMENGVTAEQLYKFAGLLRKDDDGDEDDDEDDDESSSDGSGFDPAAHPRWPAGSPGGIGGEFAPKDADTGIASSPRGGATGSWDYGATGSWDVKPPDEGRVDESYGLDAVIGIVGAIGMEAIGLLGERAAITGTTGIAEVTPSSVEVPAPLPKPEGIPDDWIEKPSRDGTGKIYSNPDNPNDVVRVMPGNPNSPNPWQQKPYVIDQDGGFQDVNGNPIPGNAPGKTQDAHIPYKNFRFKR